MSLEARKALESAVSKVGKALGELLKVAEKHGDEVSPEDYERARYFLDSTSAKLWDNISVVRDIARATSGTFSLDSVALPEPAVSGYAPLAAPNLPALSTRDTGLPDGRALAKQIGGRLTKAARNNLWTEKSVIPELAPEPSAPATNSTAPIDDSEDGVDFIDND